MNKEKVIRIALTVLLALMVVVAAALIFYGLSLGIVSIIYDVFRYYDQTGNFTMTGAILIYILLLGGIGVCVYFKRKQDAEERAYLRKRINDERFLIRNECNADLLIEMDRLKAVIRCMDAGNEDMIQYCEKYARLYCKICAIEEELERRGV